MSDQQQGQYQGNILQEFSLHLLGAPVNGSQKQPKLSFGRYKNRPTITVKTNSPTDQVDKGAIRFEPRIPDFYALMQAIRFLIATPGERKIPITLKSRKFMNGQMSQDKMLSAICLVGRDANNVIYIAIRSWNKDRPVIKFPFLPTNDNYSEANWGDEQGAPLENSQVSEYYAGGWVAYMEATMSYLLASGYVEPPKKDDNGGGNRGGGRGGYGGGGGGNYNRGGNSGGGGSNNNDFSFQDDDLPI